MTNLLETLTQQELDAIQSTANIPDAQWFNRIEQMRDKVNYIQNNCFSQKHPNAQWSSDIPEPLNNQILFSLKNENIAPESISVEYRDTIDIDPFGHDTISVFGPTLTYQNTTITGYEPAKIMIHKQNIATLTKNQITAKLQHAITHLKQAHNEQIAALESAIAPKKYANYLEPYKKALEREADFLEPIKNAQVAQIVQHAFLDEALDAALKEIKDSRQKLGLENKETSLMICATQGDGPEVLQSIASREDVKNYLNEKVEKRYESIANTLRATPQQLNVVKEKIKKDSEYIDNFVYKIPIEGIIHDPNIPLYWLEIIKNMLKSVGIDPYSINILSTEPLDSTQKQNYNQLMKQLTTTNEINP